MAAFNLTAELNLRGPTNLNQVIGNIRRQLSTLSLNLNINPNTSRGIQTVTAEVRNLSVALRDAQTNAIALATTLRALGATVGNLAGAAGGLTNINVNMNNLARTAGATGTAVRGAASEMSEFGRQSALAIRRFAAFSVATGAVYALSRAVTSAYSEFMVFNKEFIRLQQVTDSTAAGLQSLSNEITRLSTGLGVSSQELLNVSVTLAQAGLSAGETKIALEALAKSALAPSFDSLSETVEGSIALMRQFGISASDLESSLGSVNAVAAKFAVEASDLITAIQRTGGVFANASKGVSEGKDALNEFLAVFTSVRATTRESAETIATGLRTIFTRIQRGPTIDALKQYGVELTDLEGKFVGPYEAVRRLSEGLKALDPRDLRFSQIVEELGGFRQIGKVIPLIQQFETAQKALGVAQRGAGSLTADAATAQEALSVKINKVREQFIGLIRDIGQSQGFQTFVDISLKLASALISVADAAKDVLPALAAITAIRGVGALGQFFSGFAGGLGRRPRGFATGGLVPGRGNGDTVPAMLTPGEFVIRKKAVQTLGAQNLSKINSGKKYKPRKYGLGGMASGDPEWDKILRSLMSKYAHAGYDEYYSMTPAQRQAHDDRIAEIAFTTRGRGRPKGMGLGKSKLSPQEKALRRSGRLSKKLAMADVEGIMAEVKLAASEKRPSVVRSYLEKKGFDLEEVVPELVTAVKSKPLSKAIAMSGYGLASKGNVSSIQDIGSVKKQFIEWGRKDAQGNPIGTSSFASVFTPSQIEQIRSGLSSPAMKGQFENLLKAGTFGNYIAKGNPFKGVAGHIPKLKQEIYKILGVTGKSAGGFIQEFANGGFVQKFVKGGSVEDKIKKNMIDQGRMYKFGLVGLRSGTGSPIKMSERLQPDVTVGKEPNIKKYPVTLFKSTLSSVTQKEQEKTIEKDIATSFAQMVERTASTLRSAIGGSKASNNKKQQILKGSPLTSVIGTVFEAALGFLGGPYIDKSEKTKSIDFPLGLGKAAQKFDIPPNIPTDATRTIGGGGKGTSQMRGQIARFIRATEEGEFTKSFEKFKQNKLLERSKTTQSNIGTTYRSQIFDILKNSSIKDVLGANQANALAEELGVASNKLNKQAMGGSGEKSLSGTLIKQGKDPEEAFKKILDRLRLRGIKRAAKGGSISGQDTVPALLTPGEFVINKKAAKRIGGARLNRLNKADKIQGFNKGGFVGVQKFASGGMPARPTNANAFNVVVPNATIQALQDMTRVLEALGVSASSSAQLISRGTAINIRESERAYQADLNRMRIAGAPAAAIYNAEQNLARIREVNARKIDTSRELQGLSGGQLQDIQTRAERNRQRLTRRLISRGATEEEIAANQERIRRRAFEDAGAGALGTSRRGLRARGMSGESIEQYINQSMMNNRTLKQMDAQLRQTNEREIQARVRIAAAAGASAEEQNRMTQQLRARHREEITERRNIVRQLRADNNLTGGGQFRTLGTIGALFGMGELREDAFGTGENFLHRRLGISSTGRRQRIAGGLRGFNQGAQQMGFGLSFAGGMLGDTIGKAMGGKEGEAFGSAVSAFVGSAGIGAMFGPIGALTGVVVGATTAIQAWSDSIKDATIAEANKGVENASQKLQLSFNRLDKATSKADTQEALKSIGTNSEQVLRYEAEKRKALVDKLLPDKPEGFFSGLGRSLTGARTAGSWWDPTGFSGNLIDPTSLMSGQISSELVSSARQTNILQTLPQRFEAAVAKGLSIKEIQAGVSRQDMELFALATGDERLKTAITTREVLREKKQPVPETLTNFINQLSTEIFNAEFLTSFSKTVEAQRAMEAAASSATIKINLLGESLKSISAAASKGGAQFTEAQRKIQMSAGSALGETFRIQGPSRAQENILDNIQAYSVDQVRGIIGQIGQEFNFNPALTAEAQNAAANQRILGQELPKILAEIAAKEGQGFDPAGDSATVIRKKLDEVFKTSIPDEKERKGTIDRILENIKKRLGSRKDITIGELMQDEAALAEITKGDTETLKVFNDLLKQSNDILGEVINSMNGWVNSMNQATNMRVQAQTLGLTARNDLARALGEPVSLREMNQPFDNSILQLSQRIGANGQPIAGTGTLDANTIMARMIEKEKEAKDIQAQMEKEKPAIGSDRFKVLDAALRNASLEARNLAQAHEKLQTDSTRASNALSKISELRQVQESRQNAFLDFLKGVNNPSQMIDFTDEVGSFFAQMSGQGNFMNMEKAVAGLQRQLSVLNPEDQNRVRADFIDSVLTTFQQAGIVVDRQMVEGFINAMGVGATVSPEMQALIDEFMKYSNIHKDAITSAAARMETAATNFYGEVVKSAVEFRSTVSGGGQTNPVSVVPTATKQQGGLIYASKGQFVNYQPRGTDTVPAMLTPGEFVVNAKATKKNIGLLKAINQGSQKSSGFSSGGMVYMAAGGYVPVDKTLEADMKALAEAENKFDLETELLIKPISEQMTPIENEARRIQDEFYRIDAMPELGGQVGSVDTGEEIALMEKVGTLLSQLDPLKNQKQSIIDNRKKQKDIDFAERKSQLSIRQNNENMRRIAQTETLSDSEKQTIAANIPSTLSEEDRAKRQAEEEGKLKNKAKSFVADEQRNKASREQAAIDKQSIDRNNRIDDIASSRGVSRSRAELIYNYEKQQEAKRNALAAEKERRKQAFLANNPGARKKAERELSQQQKKQEEARRWYLSSNTNPDGTWKGDVDRKGARVIPKNVLAQHNKAKSQERSQANRERLLFGKPVDPSDPDAQAKKDQAKTMSKEQMAEQAERRRGIDIAKRLGWTIKDDTVVGMDYGYYEGYDPGERPAAYDKLKPEDKAALEQYQSAEYSRIKAEKRASETAAREAEYTRTETARRAADAKTTAERDAKIEAENELKFRQDKQAEQDRQLAWKKRYDDDLARARTERETEISKENKRKDEARDAAKTARDSQAAAEAQAIQDQRKAEVETIASATRVDPITGKTFSISQDGSMAETNMQAIDSEIARLEKQKEEILTRLREFYAKKPPKDKYHGYQTAEEQYSKSEGTELEKQLDKIRRIKEGIVLAQSRFGEKTKTDIESTQSRYEELNALKEKGKLRPQDQKEFTRLTIMRGPASRYAGVAAKDRVKVTDEVSGGDLEPVQRELRDEAFGEENRQKLEKKESETFKKDLSLERQTSFYDKIIGELSSNAQTGVTKSAEKILPKQWAEAAGIVAGFGTSLVGGAADPTNFAGAAGLSFATGLGVDAAATAAATTIAAATGDTEGARLAAIQGATRLIWSGVVRGVAAGAVGALRAEAAEGISTFIPDLKTSARNTATGIRATVQSMRPQTSVVPKPRTGNAAVGQAAVQQGQVMQQTIKDFVAQGMTKPEAFKAASFAAANPGARVVGDKVVIQGARTATSTTKQTATASKPVVSTGKSTGTKKTSGRSLTELSGIDESNIEDIAKGTEAKYSRMDSARKARDAATKAKDAKIRSGNQGDKTIGSKVYDPTEDMGPITSKETKAAAKAVQKAQKSSRKPSGSQQISWDDIKDKPVESLTSAERLVYDAKLAQANKPKFLSASLSTRGIFGAAGATVGTTGLGALAVYRNDLAKAADPIAASAADRYYEEKRKAKYKSTGGVVYASKGTLVPYQPRGTDTVPAMLTPGEFVVNRKSAQKHRGLLKAINNGHNIAPKLFNKGGIVSTQYYSEAGNVSQPSSSGGVSSIGIDTSSLSSVFGIFSGYVGDLSAVIGEFVQGAGSLEGLSSILGALSSLGLTESAGSLSLAGASVKDASQTFSGALKEFNSSAASLSASIAKIPSTISLTVSGSIPVNVTVRIEGGLNGTPSTADTGALEQNIMDSLAVKINEATNGGVQINTRSMS